MTKDTSKVGDHSKGRRVLFCQKGRRHVLFWLIAARNESENRLRDDLNSKLLEWDKKAEEGNLNDYDIAKREEWIMDLMQIDRMHNEDLKQKCRIKWAVEGDDNSRFFHSILKFSTDVAFLESDFSIDEVKAAVWDCAGSKAPGPDGFNFNFIKAFWDLLASRLAKVIDTIIGPNQLAFIKGRQILYGCLVANEIIRMAKLENQRLLLFKVDFEKAFDRVNWNVLLDARRPSFPYLFLLVVEALRVTILNACDIGLFKGVRLANSESNCPNLMSRGVVLPSSNCPFCESEPEAIGHCRLPGKKNSTVSLLQEGDLAIKLGCESECHCWTPESRGENVDALSRIPMLYLYSFGLVHGVLFVRVAVTLHAERSVSGHLGSFRVLGLGPLLIVWPEPVVRLILYVTMSPQSNVSSVRAEDVTRLKFAWLLVVSGLVCVSRIPLGRELDLHCATFNIPAELRPKLPDRNSTIKDSLEGKIGIDCRVLTQCYML
ncbi:hypothetical protein Tco_1293479 [Tanacetum coccineum]